MSMEWSQAQREAAAERAREFWSTPEGKKSRSRNIRKGLRAALQDPIKRANLVAAVKRGAVTRTTPIDERFWSRVNKNGPKQPHMKTRCWLWEGLKQTIKQRRVAHRIYGLIGAGPGGKAHNLLVHRYAFDLQVGGLDPNLQVQHKCDVALCVRGSHLKQGTARARAARDRLPKSNSADMRKRDRPRGRNRTISGKP
jgi:hypothetical protein